MSANVFLRGASVVYRAGVRLDRKITRPVRLPRPVISVGNIALGGRAKTPFVIAIARWLNERGRKPVVLTRGYGRVNSAPRWIRAPLESSANAELNAEAASDLVGDEPLEICAGAGADVLVGADRAKNALDYLAANDDPNVVFILDDGFQHWKLARDFDLVLIEPSDLSDDTLPAGRLREPAEALRRANLTLSRGRDFEKRSELRSRPPRERRVAALTTRAPDAAYRAQLDALWGAPLPLVQLPDHAPSAATRRELAATDATDFFIGAKEAAKVFAPADFAQFLRAGHAEKDGRHFHYVACRLEIMHAEFWPRLEGWLRTHAPR